jgi:hypothetical protein
MRQLTIIFYPWHLGYENTQFLKEWLEYITDVEKTKLIKEMGVKL